LKRTHKIIIGIVSGLSLGLATVASANPGFGPGCMQGQGYGPGTGPGVGPGMGMGPGKGMGRGHANPAAMAEGHLAWLKAELKITPAQETAWKTFADQKRQQVQAMQAWLSTTQDKTSATAVERMEIHNQWAKKRLEQGEQMTVSLKTLYAALSPEQKTLLDQGLAEGGPWRHGGPRGR